MQAGLDCRRLAAGLVKQQDGGSQKDVIEAGTGVYQGPWSCLGGAGPEVAQWDAPWHWADPVLILCKANHAGV